MHMAVALVFLLGRSGELPGKLLTSKDTTCVLLLRRFASIAKLAGQQVAPYVAQLVPKLYRYQHDPNPRVRDAMSQIWRALVDDPRAALDAHFDAVVAELRTEMGGRLWRNREAACSALADLVQVRWCCMPCQTVTVPSGYCLSCLMSGARARRCSSHVQNLSDSARAGNVWYIG